MIKFKKIYTLITENFYNLDTHSIIEISLVLYNTHIDLKNQDKFVFYINNYID